MSIHTTVRSPGAIFLGALCFIGTMVVLFWNFVEALSLAGFSQSHVYILLALVVAYGAGHFMVTSCEWSVGGFIRPVAFFILFVVATAICVALSGGRTSESLAHNEAVADNENAKRTRHESLLVEAKVDKAKAVAAFETAQKRYSDRAAEEDKACKEKVGCGTARKTSASAKVDMDAKELSAKQADSHYFMLVGQLRHFKAPEVANANLKQVAKAIAFFRGYHLEPADRIVLEARAMEGLQLYLPYAYALLTEFGSIAFFNYGFGHRRRRVETVKVETPAETVPETIAPDTPSVPPPDGRKSRKLRETQTPRTVSRKRSATVVLGPWRKKPMAERKALAFVQERLGNGGEFPSQDAIAQRTGGTKGAVSKWVSKWEAQGLITRSRDGRCNVIAGVTAKVTA